MLDRDSLTAEEYADAVIGVESSPGWMAGNQQAANREIGRLRSRGFVFVTNIAKGSEHHKKYEEKNTIFGPPCDTPMRNLSHGNQNLWERKKEATFRQLLEMDCLGVYAYAVGQVNYPRLKAGACSTKTNWEH